MELEIMEAEETKLNVLFAKDVDTPIKHAPDYYITNINDNCCYVERAPVICRGKISDIKENLAYDFDVLDENIQNAFEQDKYTLTSTGEFSDNGKRIFKRETKVLSKKRGIRQY